MTAARVLALGLLLSACGPQQGEQVAADEAPAARDTLEIDPVLLRELLGESVRITGSQIQADGMLIRLGFDPLIRKTGPVEAQLVQGQGYRLSGIADGSPLWLLGLRDGDVLTGVDKQPIIGREHELRSLYESRPSRVELAFMRGSEGHTLSLRIASGSAWRSSTTETVALPLPAPSVPSSARNNPEVAAQFANGLRCADLDAGRCELERTVFAELFANPNLLLGQARIVPAMRDGETLGWKLYGIRPNSIPKLLGLKNGDMIRTVNGIPLAMDGSLGQLRDATSLQVVLERKDKPYELEIAIVDKLSGPPQARTSGVDKDEGTPTSPDLKDPFRPGR